MEQLVCLALNPALDVTMFVRRMDPEYSPVLRESTEAAGKAVNIARTARRFGLDAPAVLLLGRENREKYLQRLREERVRAAVAQAPGETRENILVCAEDGSFLRLIRPGFFAGEEELCQAEGLLLPLLSPGTWLAASGRLPRGMSPARFAALCRRAAAQGARVAVDTASLNAQELLELRPALIKPNFEELCAMTGRRPQSAGELRELLRGLVSRGIERILLSLGEEGMVLFGEGICLRARVPRVQVRSAVGAGDNSLAGFLLAAVEGCRPEECLRRAAAFGTASVQEEGARPPRPEEVARLLPQVEIKAF